MKKKIQAIALNEECLMKTKLVYGDFHPSTLSIMYGLACDYNATIGGFVEALSLHEYCFAKMSKVLGVSHRYTLISNAALTLIYVS